MQFVSTPKMLAQSVPKTLGNQKEFDPSVLAADTRRIRDDADLTFSQPTKGSSDPSATPVGGASVTRNTSTDTRTPPVCVVLLGVGPQYPIPPKLLIITLLKKQRRRTTYTRSCWVFYLRLNLSGGGRDGDLGKDCGASRGWGIREDVDRER